MDSPGCTEILESLEDDRVSKVILAGEAGIGKTWMARKICERATREGSCYISLWLNLNKDLDEMSLYEDIASQLSIFLDKEESDEDDSEDDEVQKTHDLIRLKDKIHNKLRRKKDKGKGKKYLLLVLDDEGSVSREKKVMKDLYFGDFLAPCRPLKILLTRRKGQEDARDSDGEIESHATDMSHLEPSTIDKSQALLDMLTDDDYLVDVLQSLIKHDTLSTLDKLAESWGINYELLRHHIVRMSMRLPAALVVLVKSLNLICQNPLLFYPSIQEAFEMVIPLSSQSEIAIGSERATTDRSRENPLLRLSYKLLETSYIRETLVVDCFWHSLSFFEHCGCVSYQELIAHWILEGYFDPVRSVTNAYGDGHDILMELIKRGILKIQEDNVVMAEVAMKNLIDLRRLGLSGRSRIALAQICGSDRTKGLGKINQKDGIIEAKQMTRKGEKITTILISGNRLRRETPEKFFIKLKDLEILGLFKPTIDHFVSFLSMLVKLRVLVIRDCDLLKDIEELKALQGLHILEVSGASSLKKISDNFFMAMPDLHSLHLSGLQIKSSPSSISQLKKLHRLIIRDCTALEGLPDIQELGMLEVVDVSGARELQTCFDKKKENKSKNINFYHLQKLQLVDFSESKIDRLPIFQDAEVAAKLHSLTRLLLRNCRKLIRLPNLNPLSGLQILDLSGCSSLVRMLEECLDDKKELRVLNLSGTNLRQFPSSIENVSNLSMLLLKGCPNLEALPNIERLINLEVFDVSGCTKLQTIEGSFEDMSYLREVNLSGTKVETPELPKETKIHCVKRFTLADGKCFTGDTWSEIKEGIERDRSSENASSSGTVVTSQEITEKKSGEIREIQLDEPRASDCTEKGAASKKRLLQVPIERALYKKSFSLFDSVSQQKVKEIYGTNDLGGESLANVEFVSCVDISSTRHTSIFNEIKSVKGYWLSMCIDIKTLFSGVHEVRLGSLETLSITNLPSLETISCGSSFKNLKKLSISCCPNIITIFSEASQFPISLKDLHVKYCEKLEKVVDGVDMSTLTNLTVKLENCPNLKENSIYSDLL
ncbi:NB-ARC [Arabidopsis suecica]|uniref:NB-ARC n=1 Tax=Arabidopsis suecica TaxID=45249 RepID=A0A8T2DMC2_ARASU|nr:NB-ARC [Arabidopsis suecica]